MAVTQDHQFGDAVLAAVILKELNGLSDSLLSFLSSNCYSTISSEKVAIKLSFHFFEIVNKTLWVLSYFIMKVPDLSIDFWNCISWYTVFHILSIILKINYILIK